MILDPGSFSGNSSSPSPDLGPEARNLISFAIFIKETAIVLSAPWKYTKSSCDANDSNLFPAGIKLNPVSSLRLSATLISNPLYVFKPVPTAVPPIAILSTYSKD